MSLQSNIEAIHKFLAYKGVSASFGNATFDVHVRYKINSKVVVEGDYQAYVELNYNNTITIPGLPTDVDGNHIYGSFNTNLQTFIFRANALYISSGIEQYHAKLT